MFKKDEIFQIFLPHDLSLHQTQKIETYSLGNSRKKIFHWKREAKFRSQHLFVRLCSEAEILQDLILHN